MRLYSPALACGACVIAITCGAGASTLPVIDDFTTGKVSLVVNGAKQTGDVALTSVVMGKKILGGARLTNFLAPLTGNPFRLNAQLGINKATETAPAALTISSGFQMSVRAEFAWGNSVNAPLNVNLKTIRGVTYDRFRVHFLAADGDQDFVMETFSSTGAEGEWGCQLASSPYHPVVVDMPFANSPGAELTHVTEVGAVIQGGAYGFDSGISLIEVVPAGTPPADMTCPQIGKAKKGH